VIGRQVSHFYVIRTLGSGGMGVVYEAQDTRLPRSVAIKFLKPGLLHDLEANRRFRREARLASSLNHPNICTILDVDEGDRVSFIAMELLHGMSLKARVAAGPLSLDEIVSVTTQVVDALEAAHVKGVLHRDITPGNIFVCESGQVKLLDFGLAKQMTHGEGDGDASDDLTAHGRVVGTIHYMAPEQLREPAGIDQRCDLFSLGGVLYHMATGARPFEARTGDDVLTMIREQPHVPIRALAPEHPPWLGRIIDRLLAKRPQDRYQTATSVKEELQELHTDILRSERVTPRRQSRPDETAIAVLPFAIVGRHSLEFEEFRDGLVEDLSSQLASIGHVRVAPRASTRAAVGQGVRALGEQLGVHLVLEGSLQHADDQIRVIANLFHSEDERPALKPITFDRPAHLTLDGQHEVAAHIAQRLSPALEKRVEDVPTRDMEALHAFKRGQHQFLTSCYAGGWRTAIEHFQHAIARDPKFTLAHVAIATAYNFLGYYCLIKPNLAFSVAAQSAERALAIDSSFAPAYAALASVRFGRDWDWNGAEAHFRRALDLDPSDAEVHIYYSWLLTLLGRVDVGLAEVLTARTIAPGSAIVAVGAAHSLYIARRFDEAIEICTQVLGKVPTYVFAHHVRGLCHLSKGMGPQAIADFEVTATLSKRTPFYLALLGLSYGAFGRQRQARDLVDELNQLSRETYVHPQCYIFIYAGLGDQEKTAFEERSFEHGASPLNYLTPYLRELYELDPHRSKRLEQMRLLAS
jgi:eukaryotic-like serine/threonine-protein kinase